MRRRLQLPSRYGFRGGRLLALLVEEVRRLLCRLRNEHLPPTQLPHVVESGRVGAEHAALAVGLDLSDQPGEFSDLVVAKPIEIHAETAGDRDALAHRPQFVLRWSPRSTRRSFSKPWHLHLLCAMGSSGRATPSA